MKKTLLFFAGLLFSIVLYSQSVLTPFQDWTTTAGSQNFFEKNITKTDAAKNVYIAGATLNSAGNYDMLLQKINSAGSVLWTKQYDGLAHSQDMATNLFIDASSNVYIVGEVVNDTVTGFSDIITIKYNSSGVQQWVATYNGSGSAYDAGSCITLDGSGNVFVGGSGFNSSGNTDYIAVKYNSSGVQQWASQYNGSAGLNDAAIAINIASGQVIVTGLTQSTTTSYKPLTLVLNIGTGATIGTSLGSTGSSSMDVLNAVVKDASGNLYFAGGTPISGHGYDFTTIKVTSAGVLAWEVDYNGASGLDDIANGVQVDATGNVYTTGYTTTSTGQKNMMTVKYNSSGTQQWIETYNDSLNGNDEGKAIVLNGTNIYVTGYDSTAMNGTDYYTLKYNSSGTEQWHIRADGDAHLEDKATNLAIDTSGNLIVSGESKKLDGSYEYKTIRYIEHNTITPTDYNSEAPDNAFLYYPNKGQLVNTSHVVIPTVKYYTNRTYPAYYVNANSYSMVFGHVDTVISTQDTLQRIDVAFTQVNTNAKTYSLEEHPDFLNYYLPQCPQGITEVHGNQRLITTDLYTNIDMIYYSNQNGLKYYFIVKPGGDPTKIKMEYTGASSFNLNGTTNELTISSAFGSVAYDRPTVYQLNTSNVIIPIAGWTADWQVNGVAGKYKFNIGAYDNTKPLIIQVDMGNASGCTPATTTTNIRLSSYYGAPYWDLERATASSAGVVYYVGNTLSNNFPVTNLTSNLLSDQDVVVSKFDSYGNQKFATYWGGTAADDALGVTLNHSGYAYVVGNTRSTDIVMTHHGGSYYQASGNGGGSDGFVAKFDITTGTIFYSCYFGGAGDETFNRSKNIMIDSPNDYLYIVGSGTEASPHVTETGAYNSLTTPSGTKGIIAKFDYKDSLLWSTFIGDNIKGVDISGYLIGIGGSTVTSDLPFKHTGTAYIDSTYNNSGATGNEDAFFGILNFPKDTVKWMSIYGGSKSDICNSVKFDNGIEGTPPNLFGAGQTGLYYDDTTNNLPLYNPGGWAYHGTFHGKVDAVMWKFSATGQRLWVSCYGTGSEGANQEYANDVVVDSYNNVYFCGSTSDQMENIPFSTHNWYNQNYSSTSGGYQAFLFAVTSRNLNMFWATNFGGANGEEGSGLCYDDNKYLYMTGYTFTPDNTTFPAYRPSGYLSPPAWYVCNHQSTFGEGDGYFAQFDLSNGNLAGIEENKKPNENDLISYPNPFTGEITFNFSVEDSKGYTIEVYNTLGQIVYSEKEVAGISKVSKTIDLSQINKGMYFVQVKLSNRILAGKILRQ